MLILEEQVKYTIARQEILFCLLEQLMKYKLICLKIYQSLIYLLLHGMLLDIILLMLIE